MERSATRQLYRRRPRSGYPGAESAHRTSRCGRKVRRVRAAWRGGVLGVGPRHRGAPLLCAPGEVLTEFAAGEPVIPSTVLPRLPLRLAAGVPHLPSAAEGGRLCGGRHGSARFQTRHPAARRSPANAKPPGPSDDRLGRRAALTTKIADSFHPPWCRPAACAHQWWRYPFARATSAPAAFSARGHRLASR